MKRLPIYVYIQQSFVVSMYIKILNTVDILLEQKRYWTPYLKISGKKY